VITTKTINNEIKDIIQTANLFKGIKRVGIFGSYARNEQTPDSDFDILFEYYYKNDIDNGIDDTLKYLNIIEENLNKYLSGTKIDFISYNGVLDSDNNELKQNILNDVYWVYEN